MLVPGGNREDQKVTMKAPELPRKKVKGNNSQGALLYVVKGKGKGGLSDLVTKEKKTSEAKNMLGESRLSTRGKDDE